MYLYRCLAKVSIQSATNGYDFSLLEQKQSLVIIETYMLYGVNLKFNKITAIVNIIIM